MGRDGHSQNHMPAIKKKIFTNNQTLFNSSAIPHVYHDQGLNPQWPLRFLMTENGPSSSDLKNFPNNKRMPYCRGQTGVKQLRNYCQWFHEHIGLGTSSVSVALGRHMCCAVRLVLGEGVNSGNREKESKSRAISLQSQENLRHLLLTHF